MTVATRLSLGFGGVVVLGVAIAATGALQMDALSTQLDEIANDKMIKIEKLSHLKDNMNAIARASRNILISKEAGLEAAEKAKIAEARAENTQLLAELDRIVVLPRPRELLKIINDTRPGYNRSIDEVLALDASGNTEGSGKLLLGPVREQQNIIFKAVDETAELQRRIAADLAHDAKGSSARAALMLLGLAVAMAALGAIVTWLTVRNFKRALGAEPATLGAAAQRVAAGDLSLVAGATNAPTGSVLASLADMQSRLATIVAQVRASSYSIATGSSEIATGNTDLSQRTEEQARNLQQTAASMEQLSGTVRNTADTAAQASQLATSASTAAVRGGELVGDVVTTMQEIAQASGRIGNIIGVIDGIAFQTNILALNAAVEAARAGEQGRGFAVVASEVRNLASRSAEAAKEIKVLIGASVEKVEAGTRQVNEAGASMGQIVSQVQRVNQAIGEISSATTEQSTGISQIGDSVIQLDQVTQRNAALVEESAAAAESLKQQAAKLADVVSLFKVDGVGSVSAPLPAAQASARTERSVTKPAATATPRPPSQAPVTSKPTVTAAARPAPAKQTSSEAWETF